MKKIFKILLHFVLLMLCCKISFAQVLVYKLKIHDQKKGVNYEFYESGYFIASASTGTGTFLFTISKNGIKTYIEATDAGDLFFALDNKKVKHVLRARSDSEDSLSSLLAIGNAKTKVKTSEDENGNTETKTVAKNLKGYFIASDSEASQSFDPTDKNVGFAGISEITLSLNFTRTKLANQNSQSVSDVVTGLSAELEAQGFVTEEVTSEDSETTTETTTDTTE